MLDLPGHGRTAPSVDRLGRDVPDFPGLVDCVEDFVLHVTGAPGGGGAAAGTSGPGGDGDEQGGTTEPLPFFLFGHSWGGVLTFLTTLRPAVAALMAKGDASPDDVPTTPTLGKGVILSAPAFRVGGNVLVPKPCVVFTPPVPLTHSRTHSLTHSPAHPHTHLLTHSHLLTHPLAHFNARYWAVFRGLANVMATVAPRLPSPAAKSSELTCDVSIEFV
jgi:alpha-beta hydrolase superfamily lysophospholipase